MSQKDYLVDKKAIDKTSRKVASYVCVFTVICTISSLALVLDRGRFDYLYYTARLAFLPCFLLGQQPLGSSSIQ